MSVLEKLSDALLMFWQALDEQEKKLLVVGVVWLGATVIMIPVSRGKAERERDLLVDRVVERLADGR